MCIIIYKPKNQFLPSHSILKNCWNRNPDGAGFMYSDSQKIHIQKGFMSLTELENSLNSLINIFNIDLVIHFRFATHGSISPSCCHPFPLTSKIKELQQTDITTKTGIAHNGIINFCSPSNSLKNKLSDSQIFIKDYLSQIPAQQLKNPAIQVLIEKSTNSKFAILTGDQIYLIGNFKEDNGIYYSNDSYLQLKRDKIKYISYNECGSCDYFDIEQDFCPIRETKHSEFDVACRFFESYDKIFNYKE